MKVDKLNVGKAFDFTERLEAPLFQRPYVWNEERNWEPLWEAIRPIAERHLAKEHVRPHFLGAIVLDQVQTQLGRVPIRQIIDGQQRLTTLQLALAAVRDLSNALDRQNYAQAFNKLIRNEVPLSEDPTDLVKVWPTNADRDEYGTVMEAGAVEPVKKLAKKNDSLVAGAYVYFWETFDAWLKEGGEEQVPPRLDALYRTLKDNLVLVVIDLENDDDAQEIFETLNTLGTPLLTADIVKNYLIRLAERGKENVAKLYEWYWADFDAEKSYWREETGRGRQKRSRIDLFLHHYVTLQTAQEVNASQLFSAFKDFVGNSNGQTAAQHMGMFRSYAEVYAGFEKFPRESREGTFFYRLTELEMTTAYPVLLEVFKRLGGPEHRAEREEIFTTLESYFVRRTVCELTTRSYGKMFVALIKSLKDKNDWSAAGIRSFLAAETADASRWPDDEEFRKAWLNLNFYKRLKRAKLRVILEAIEPELRDKRTEVLPLPKGLTVEHLMPREWERHWPLPAGTVDIVEATERRENLIHRIGNLTLLTRELNPAVSNGPWEKKREAILKYSLLNLNHTLPREWNEGHIDDRTKTLFDIALAIWPRISAAGTATA
jgi:uncharacterized protein with ParB-like and HNH nuclease domain